MKPAALFFSPWVVTRLANPLLSYKGNGQDLQAIHIATRAVEISLQIKNDKLLIDPFTDRTLVLVFNEDQLIFPRGAQISQGGEISLQEDMAIYALLFRQVPINLHLLLSDFENLLSLSDFLALNLNECAILKSTIITKPQALQIWSGHRPNLSHYSCHLRLAVVVLVMILVVCLSVGLPIGLSKNFTPNSAAPSPVSDDYLIACCAEKHNKHCSFLHDQNHTLRWTTELLRECLGGCSYRTFRTAHPKGTICYSD